VWDATVQGRPLKFHLAGINNQNFIMRDEQTGSWWQQVNGEALLGPLKGQHLTQIVHDEVSFGIWRNENPGGRVLRPDQRLASDGKYAPADWERHVASLPIVSQTIGDQRLEPRALVIGVTVNGDSKAYPFAELQSQRPLIDSLGGIPLLIIVGEDRSSVRAYQRLIEGREVEFFAKTGQDALRLIDSETGSEWSFTGKALSGPLAGRQLQKVVALKDYWFDWQAYHPDTLVYHLEQSER
jgi:uncharacterized protein DUF3179